MLYQVDIPLKQKNILHQFLSIALGGNTYLHPYIDDTYQKNEWDYYEAYQKSSLKENPLFSMYTSKSEDKIRKVAGMVEWCHQNRQYTQIDYLIKKGYKFVYQYLQQQTSIDFEHFMRSFAKKQKSKIVKEIELIYQNTVLWYLCVRENKPFNTNNIAWTSFQEVLSASINESVLQKMVFSDEMIQQHRGEIDLLYAQYQIPKNPRFESLGVLFESLISDKAKHIYQTNPDCSTERAEQLVFQESPTKYIGALGGWLKTLKIHELDATEQMPMSKTDLDMVFLELIYSKKYNYISEEEQDLFFISCLYLKCLSTLYRETKYLYLDESKQDYYLDIKSKEEQLREQEAELFKRKREWDDIYQQQQNEIEGLKQELRNKNAQIRQLEREMESLDDYTHEVHALRNFVFSEQQELMEQPPSMKMMIDFIDTKRIVIFGGALKWRQKLNEFLPVVEFVDVEEINRDMSKIRRVDAVFVNTRVFSHAFYKKIIKELNEKPLFYLNGQSNVEKTILEIYKWLTE